MNLTRGWPSAGSQHEGAGRGAADYTVRNLVNDVALGLILQLHKLSCRFLTRIATYFREKTAVLRSASGQLF